MAKKTVGVFYLDSTKAYFYGSNRPTPVQVDLPADAISYFDVVNKETFYKIIQTLVTTNKLQPVPLMILLAPGATYEKDVEGKTSDEINTVVEQFIEVVPYERVLSRTFKVQEKTKVVSINKDLYEVIKRSFEKVGFTIVGITALPLLQKVMPEIGTNLNLEVIANKFEGVRQYSLITADEMNNSGKTNQEQTDTNKPNPLRLYGLIGVFVVLIGILIFMVMQTLKPQPVPVKKKATPVVVLPTTTPMPTAVLTPSVTPIVSGKAVVSSTPLSSTPKVVASPTPVR